MKIIEFMKREFLWGKSMVVIFRIPEKEKVQNYMNEARNELCHSLSNLYLAERPCVAFFLQFAANASFILF